MNPQSISFEDLICKLPPHLQAQVKHYAEFVLTKHRTTPKKPRRLRQDWADALEDDKATNTSYG